MSLMSHFSSVAKRIVSVTEKSKRYQLWDVEKSEKLLVGPSPSADGERGSRVSVLLGGGARNL